VTERVQWKELLKRWEIHQTQPTKERLLFACKPYFHVYSVYNIKTANVFLKMEKKRWLRSQQGWKMVVIRFAGKVPTEGLEELAKATKPAVGFWLFPAEALGDLTDNSWDMKEIFDMTGYWPELKLSDIY
jgi:hypothetical protein